MGKTHFSGLAVGDPSIGVYGGAMLCQSYRFDAPGEKKINFSETSLIRDVLLTNDAGISIPGDVKLGTSSGGTQIYTGTLVAGTPGTVYKKASGTVYASSSVANSTLWITYATGGE